MRHGSCFNPPALVVFADRSRLKVLTNLVNIEGGDVERD